MQKAGFLKAKEGVTLLFRPTVVPLKCMKWIRSKLIPKECTVDPAQAV